MASGQPPSFYHILMNPSSTHLPLPLKFVKKHLKNRALKHPVLKSANGGYSWNLKMKKFDDHSFCFVNGWCNVVKDLGLLFGEFLLFKYVGSSVFLMHVYSVNGCEKILVPRISNNFKVVEDDDVSVFDDYDVEDEVEEDDDEVSVFDDDADTDTDMEYDLEEDEDEDNEEDDEVEFGDDDSEADGEDEDVVDIDGDDGDPFFVITSSKRNRNKLRLPPDLVAMAKIITKETIILKNDDGYEKKMPVRSYKQNKSTRYYVAEGWSEFQRSNDVSEGDECVLKFITSEDKLCLAKVTKKKPRATEVNNDDMDDDDGMDEEGEVEDAKEDDSNVDGDDIFVDDEGKGETAKHVNDDEDNEDHYNIGGDDIFDDDVDDECKDRNAELVNENEDDEDDSNAGGDDIFDDANDEGKGRNAKLVNENEDDEDDSNVGGDDIFDDDMADEGKGKNAKLVNENKDDEDDSNVGGDDIFDDEGKGRNAKLANENEDDEDDDVDGEGKGENAKLVNENEDDEDDDVDGEAKGENAKLLNENKDDEDDDVDGEGKGENAKFVIENEDYEDDDVDGEAKGEKAKHVNENDDEDDDMDGEGKGENAKLVNENEDDEDDDVDGEGKGENAKLVNENEDDEDDDVDGEGKGENAKHVNENEDNEDDNVDGEAKGEKAYVNENEDDEDDDVDGEGHGENAKLANENEDGEHDDVDGEAKGDNAKLVNENEDNEDDDRGVDGDDGDPSFISTCSDKNQYHLSFSADFVALAGINTKKTITLKNLDGYEKELRVRSQSRQSRIVKSVTVKSRRNRLKGYFLAAGWKEFQRRSNISEGDKFVFKFITSEDKFCVAKITKKKTRARPLPPDAEAQVTEVDDGMDDEDVEDAVDKDENVEPVDDLDPFFEVTIKNHRFKLGLPTDFVALAGIESKENIIMKSLDRNETLMSILKDKRYSSTCYHLSVGWSAFKRSNNISEGDKCVFKYITSEDKLCLAQITKAPPTEVDDNDVGVDNGMSDKDANKDAELIDDEDPFFRVTITPSHKSMLRLPSDFVELAGIIGKKNIIIKCLDGNEIEMVLRPANQGHSTGYCLSMGWPAFKRSNNISEGDECVFKYITSADKMCLEKVTKKITPPTEVDDNGMGDKDANKDAELIDDEDPFFRVTIAPSHKSMLRLPSDFVKLAGIFGKKNIIIKCLDGNEIEMVLRPVNRGHSTCYLLSMGWPAFKRSNNISEGDECVFKYITSEDKMCLAKITKKITPLAEVDDNDLKVDDGKNVVVDDTRGDDENVEPVDDSMDVKDVVVDNNKHEDGNFEVVDDGMDVDADDNKGEDKDVEFVVTITPSHKSKLRLPPDFVRLSGIDGKKDIIIKCPDGNERKMVLTPVQQGHLTRYCLSIGWRAFKHSNYISEGDECVFKYITGEDKMRLTLTTKKEARATPLPLAAETRPTEVDDNMDGDEYVKLDDDGIDDKDVNGDDLKDADGNVELADSGMDVDDENNDEDANVERVNDGMDDKDVDEYAKLVDGMDDKDIELDNNNDEDENENVELDDGMDDKDVDEYVELVDGVNDKDVNEDAELVDDEDPFFRVTITSSNKSMLRLPLDFVGLTEINTKKNIIIKSLNGNETEMPIRSYKQQHYSTQYHLSVGWPAYKQSNNISEGDECVFKYITSEDKLCLAKVNKEKTQTSLQSPAKVVKRKRARLPPATEIKLTVAESVKKRSRRPPPVEITVAEAVKRKRGPPPPSSPRVTKDVKSKKGRAAV